MVLLFRISALAAVPLGIFLLVRSIKALRRVMDRQTVFAMSYAETTGTCIISQAGDYTLWLTGKAFRINPIAKRKPKITDLATNREVPLRKPLLRTQSNDGSRGSVELYTVTLSPGTYRVALLPGSSVSWPERLLVNQINSNVEPADFTLEMREVHSAKGMVGAILSIIAGTFLTIGGIVLVALAGKLLD